MRKLIYKLIEPAVQTLITERLILFHAALLERGQISPPNSTGPRISDVMRDIAKGIDEQT